MFSVAFGDLWLFELAISLQFTIFPPAIVDQNYKLRLIVIPPSGLPAALPHIVPHY